MVWRLSNNPRWPGRRCRSLPRDGVTAPLLQDGVAGCRGQPAASRCSIRGLGGTALVAATASAEQAPVARAALVQELGLDYPAELGPLAGESLLGGGHDA